MDQFILLGDSITQAAFSPVGLAFGPRLSHDYARKLDILNRGYSGYNTSQILSILPRILPSPETAHVRVLCIFLGANDARLPNTPGPAQDVSLDEYVANLRAIVTQPEIVAHEGVRVLFVTPPPVHEAMCFEGDKAKFGAGVITAPRRTAVNTRSYATASNELGSELGLPVVDLWKAILREARYDVGRASDEADRSPPGSMDKDAWFNERLGLFLSDGLHLTSEGYEVFYRELTRTIDENWPELIPDNMQPALPNWDDEAAWK
ncbi:hypothetical protein MBLNU230_g4837t1 [Neophaeotheca triangularis]